MFIVSDEARELVDEYLIIYLPVARGIAPLDLASQRVNLKSELREGLVLLPDAAKEASVWCRSSLSPRVEGHHLRDVPEGDIVFVLEPLRAVEEAVVAIDFIDALFQALRAFRRHDAVCIGAERDVHLLVEVLEPQTRFGSDGFRIVPPGCPEPVGGSGCSVLTARVSKQLLSDPLSVFIL